MKTTPEKIAELKTLKMPDWLARKDDPWAHEAAWAITNLIADLEEAKEQLASPFMDGYEAAKEEYRPQIIAAEADRDHWRANHDNVVAKLRLFTQREDLPVDRLPAYEHVLELEKKLAEAQEPHINIAHSYVQEVPDHCDRITWRGRYFHLHGINSIVAIDAALDAAIAEAIEPYRKDAACWQFARKELCRSRSVDKEAKWVMYIEMDAPIITAGQLRDDSVAESLDAAVLAAIAAKGETNEQTT